MKESPTAQKGCIETELSLKAEGVDAVPAMVGPLH